MLGVGAARAVGVGRAGRRAPRRRNGAGCERAARWNKQILLLTMCYYFKVDVEMYNLSYIGFVTVCVTDDAEETSLIISCIPFTTR